MEFKNDKETKVKNPYCILITKEYDHLAWPSYLDEEKMLLYMKLMQQRCNELLKYRGLLTLKDVCCELNVSAKGDWDKIGWIYDEYTFVDFGLNEHLLNPFMHGFDKILLSFNAHRIFL